VAKIGFIGEEDFVLGFKGIGGEAFIVSNKEEVLKSLERAKRGNCSIVYLSETFAEEITKEVEELNKKSGTNIVVLPGLQPPKHLGRQNIRRVIRRAVGRDILEGNDETTG